MLEHALAYLERGISIFPLIENSKNPLAKALPLYDDGKEIKPSWAPFQHERPTKEQVIKWWTKYPKANIGGVTGEISGIICLDQDVSKDENKMPILDEFGNPLKRGDISGFFPTLSTTTWSGGKHMIYKFVEGVRNLTEFRELVDLRGEGGYMVLPPSIVNGKEYEWNDDWKEAIDTLIPFQIDLLPNNDHEFSPKSNFKDFVSVSHGSRNDRMHKLACSLYARGASNEEVAFITTEINKTYKPPIGEMRGDNPNELENIVNSAKNFISKSNYQKIQKINKEDFKLVPWGEFEALKFPENPWRVEKLIPESGITILAAPSGARKSWVILDMIRDIAKGDPFLGMFKTKKCNVMYVEQETPQEEIQRRGKQLRFPREGIHIVSSKGEPLNLNNDDSVRHLSDLVKLNNISVVVIDTLRSVSGGLKEEKAEEVRAFFNRYKPMAEQGVSVIFLDHTRKPKQFENRSKPAMEQILGSQDKIASATNVLMLGPTSEEDIFSLHQMKLKSGKEEKPFVIKMRDEDGESGRKTYLEYGGGFDEDELKVEQAKDFILEYLEEQKDDMKTKEIIGALKDKVGKSNIETALKQMRKEEAIGFKKAGGNSYVYWSPTRSEESEDLGVFDSEQSS